MVSNDVYKCMGGCSEAYCWRKRVVLRQTSIHLFLSAEPQETKGEGRERQATLHGKTYIAHRGVGRGTVKLQSLRRGTEKRRP